jgi:ribulose-phosphate 3-epimerase
LEAQAVVDTLQLIKQFGMDAGIAINPETSLEKISDIGQEVSVIMVMGIHPGKQGQPFLTSTYDRVKEVRNICETVAVDGSVNDMTAARLVAAGASRLVIGSYLQKGDIDENLEKIWEIIG